MLDRPVVAVQPRGPRGPTGPMPDHEIDGPRIRFREPDATFGPWINTLGPEGPIGNAQNFDTKAHAAASIISAGVKVIRTAGGVSIDDGGGAEYHSVSPEPAHDGKLQTADGGWWELLTSVVTPEMFGAVSTDTAANNTAFASMVAYLGVRGGGVALLNKLYQTTLVIDVIDRGNITFSSLDRGGIWHRGGVGTGNPVLFYMQDSDNVKFEHLELRGDVGVIRAEAWFGIMMQRADDLHITDCYFHDLLVATWSWNSRGLRIRDNSVYAMQADGFHIENGCTDFLVNGNDIESCGDDCIAIVGDLSRTVSDPPNHPTYIRPQKGVISGNHVRRAWGGGTPIRLCSCDYVTVSDNTTDGSSAAGIITNIHDDGLPPTNIVIKGNHVIDPSRHYTGDAFYVIPSPNDAAACGIGIFWGKNIVVANNTVMERVHINKGVGIHVDGNTDNVTIDGNMINDCYGGINVTDAAAPGGGYIKNVSVVNNTISIYANTIGIFVGRTAVIFSNLLISNNTVRNSPLLALAYYHQNLAAACDIVITNNTSFQSGAITNDLSGTIVTANNNAV